MSSIKFKLLYRVLVLFIFLFVISQFIEYKSFRDISIEAAENQAKSIAELVKASLTSMMLSNSMESKDMFLENIMKIENVAQIRLIRSESVNEQFKKNYKTKPTEEEKYVLRTGKPYRKLEENLQKAVFTVIIPYKVESFGNINCTDCHNAKPGDILGAISVKMDLTPLRDFATSRLLKISVLSFFVFILTAFVMIRFLKPYIEFLYKLKNGLSKAKDGDFSCRIDVKTKDEAEEVSNTFNETMSNLSKTLNHIEKQVAYLIGDGIKSSGNALKDTSMIVKELVNIYKFKRIVEKDSSKEEIYSRLRKLMKKMGITKYSIYEVDTRRNILIDIDESAKWCKDVVFTDADQCRVKRTGAEVNSEEFPCVCPNFINCSEEKESEENYVCIPIYVGGKVGIILQLIYNDEEKEEIHKKLPFIECYIREVAPVIESKSFMELLKEQSLKDQLTGLHNRRFLEELIPKLTKQILRRNSNLGILMIDIDFFKQINDQYGHDAGDSVLKKVAEIIRTTVRESDFVIRYGGEEFMVLLVDSQVGKAVEVAEKIRKRVEKSTIQVGSLLLNKTVSIGVSEFPADTDKFWQAVKFADVALYKAKEEGRNRVVRFEKDMWQSDEY